MPAAGGRRRPAEADRAYRDHRPDEPADALLLPLDDLALAAAVKSPLFGLTDDDLFKLASGGARDRCARRLAEKAATDNFEAALRCLRHARRGRARDAVRLLRLAARQRRRRAVLRRLGHEARCARRISRAGPDLWQRDLPSLQGFMAWLRAADTEVKRDMEIRATKSGS